MDGNVTIINYSTNADSIVASAGRISTTTGSAGEIYEKSCAREREANRNLIQKILSSGHKSVLEHVSVNLAFDNVSVFVEQFMIEFRLASFTVKSRRYVDFGQMGYYIPDFSGHESLLQTYREHMDSLFSLYDEFVEKGVPKEDARFLLPYCFKSNFYCTLNARELEKVMGEMMYGRGKHYPELAMLGKELYRQCEEILPYLRAGNFHYDETEEILAEEMGGSRASDNGNLNSGDVPKKHPDLMELISAPDEPEQLICRAAAMKRSLPCDESLFSDKRVQGRILQALLKDERKRELEQAHFTFRFNRISLAGVTHLVRHRMQSVIIPDYFRAYDFGEYVIPKSVTELGLEVPYREAFDKSGKVLADMLAAGLPVRDSVYFLLSGLTIPVFTTMNANELETFMRLRTCNRAQWEIKQCADALLGILRERYPVLFSLYGPGCYMLGYCPEGKMTCGKMEEMRSRYQADYE